MLAGGVALLAVAMLAWRFTGQSEPLDRCRLVNGPVALPDLPEASGLALSRRTPGLLWSHNDSGNAEILFAIDASGAVVGQVRVPMRARDWEDISSAPCASGDCLYLADIGDNQLERRSVAIYRVQEPSTADTQTAPPDRFIVSYADGRHNAEAAFVFDDRLYIVTKDRTGGLYQSAARFDQERTLVLERIGELGLVGVTDAELSSDGALVVVRTLHEAVFYGVADLARGTVDARVREPLDSLGEAQGEAVAFDASGLLYLASEGRPWTGGGALLTLRCAIPG